MAGKMMEGTPTGTAASTPTMASLDLRSTRRGGGMGFDGDGVPLDTVRSTRSRSSTDGEFAIQLRFRTNSILEDMRIERTDSRIGTGTGRYTATVEDPIVQSGSGGAPTLETDVHLVSVEQLEQRFHTSADQGLDELVAGSRLVKEGRNVLQPPKDLPLAVKFLITLFEGFGMLLWVGAILCFIAWYPLSYKQDGGIYNLALSMCLVFVTVLNGIFQFAQERRSSKVMEQFRKLLPSQAKVLRKGQWTKIDAAELVRGDVILVKAGEKVPADLRVLSTKDGKVDKSALTGEPDPIPLAVACTDRNHHETRNLAQFGTLLTEGEVVGLVVATGSKTTMGGISDMVQNAAQTKTTLHIEVNHFVVIVATLAVVTGIVSFSYWAGSLRTKHPGFLDLPTMIVNCISLIVAYVPLGLPVSVTLTLSLIAAKMAQENMLVKKLGIVDTLGCVSTIASDKTGTLTQNRMSVAHVLTLSAASSSSSPAPLVQDVKDVGGVSDQVEDLFRAAVLCSRASFLPDPANLAKPLAERGVDGDATEAGLLRFCSQVDEARVSELRQGMPKISELPFNSRNKWQLSLHRMTAAPPLLADGGDQQAITVDATSEAKHSDASLVVMKGAPERLLTLCSRARVHGAGDVPLSADTRAQLLKSCDELAAKGERVLAFCDRVVEQHPQVAAGGASSEEESRLTALATTSDLRFVGFVTLMDPPRPEVPPAVLTCREAGIRVMMVTGDHHATAAAIARKVNIITAERVCGVEYLANLADGTLLDDQAADLPAIVVTGEQLPTLDEAMWTNLLKHKEIVFARTTPAQKLLIARNVQESGERMAMTGDGVNDAPALRQANVGIAMGKTGTDVAKEAACIILLDDNFTSIVRGIERGRLAFENLKKIVSYLLPAGSFSEATPIIANVFLGMPLPLSSFLMIIICMLTDVSGSITLVYEEAEGDLMKVRPRDAKKDKLVDRRLMTYGFFQTGVYESFVGFFMYFLAMYSFSHGRLLPRHLVFAWEAWTNDAPYQGLSLGERSEILYKAQTAYFVSLVMVQIWNVLGVARTRRTSVTTQRWNRATLLGASAEVLITLFMVFVPFINSIFFTRPLPFSFFAYPFLFGIGLMLIMELLKAIRHRSPLVDNLLGW